MSEPVRLETLNVAAENLKRDITAYFNFKVEHVCVCATKAGDLSFILHIVTRRTGEKVGIFLLCDVDMAINHTVKAFKQIADVIEKVLANPEQYRAAESA